MVDLLFLRGGLCSNIQETGSRFTRQSKIDGRLAHDLTVATRSIWSTGSLPDAEKVDRMKWLNEILHRVTAKTACLRRHTHEWTEHDFGSMVHDYIAENQAIGPLVNHSLWRCLELAARNAKTRR
jgi:hypothetical protein